MKRLCVFAALLLSWACPPGADAATPADVAGNYQLQGVHEMAGALSLSAKDNRYRAQFSYGAADWIETGTWKVDGDTVVLSGGRFQATNYADLSLLLPSGTRFAYTPGVLDAADPERHLRFVDANKTPPSSDPAAAGEGRMRVRGTVVSRDADLLVVKVNDECMDFSVSALAPALRTLAKGAAVDAEIPYDAIIGGESCPH